jgi:hypothetical protein
MHRNGRSALGTKPTLQGAAVLTMLLLSNPASAESPCGASNSTIVAAVNGLTYELHYDGRSARFVEIFDLLLQHPRDAACSLIADLRVVPGRNIRPINAKEAARFASALHMIDVIRALRYVTGCLDFRVPTRESFNSARNRRSTTSLDDLRAEFLHRDGLDVPFFANWMSRDINFLAAPDAQRAIIGKWKDWLATSEGFHFRKCENFNDWYF